VCPFDAYEYPFERQIVKSQMKYKNKTNGEETLSLLNLESDEMTMLKIGY
jgi:hypothetical protein